MTFAACLVRAMVETEINPVFGIDGVIDLRVDIIEEVGVARIFLGDLEVGRLQQVEVAPTTGYEKGRLVFHNGSFKQKFSRDQVKRCLAMKLLLVSFLH